MKFRIFICYSQADFFDEGIDVRNYLADHISDSHVFIDQLKTKGIKWRPKNEEELRNSDLIIVIVTPASLTSDEIKREIKIAMEKPNTLLIPCKDENVELKLEELPWNLAEFDGFEFNSTDFLKRKLYREITKIRKDVSKQRIKDFESQKKLAKSPILLELNKKMFWDGEIVYIRGKIKEINVGVPTTFKIISPHGDIIQSGELKIEKNKEFFISFATGGTLIPSEGLYNVIIRHGPYSNQTTIKIKFRKSYKNKQNHIVKILPGSSVPDTKFVKPETVEISKGDDVTWLNDDTAAHTITSGTAVKGPDGKFDSGLLVPDNNITFDFKKKGTYKYHCMLHPWSEGTIIVE